MRPLPRLLAMSACFKTKKIRSNLVYRCPSGKLRLIADVESCRRPDVESCRRPDKFGVIFESNYIELVLIELVLPSQHFTERDEPNHKPHLQRGSDTYKRLKVEIDSPRGL